ncbi:hypothetical protein COLO4_37599 [Corchorus olitorius]|uniref:Uncharacterized protein n=1 Tax=Corchorus olitorius TaxID=93759 RepID=A0A1R3G0K0_9ROSI|nr:hypothetical protein COLO4_37599 [Corchorus olitorius]
MDINDGQDHGINATENPSAYVDSEHQTINTSEEKENREDESKYDPQMVVER